MRVKVCGITTLEDARLAVDLGAWALGFNFYPKSPRFISSAAAAKIIIQLPKDILTIGVFVNATLDMILSTQNATGISIVQLHGDETPAFCQQIQQPVIKAIRPKIMNDLKSLSEYRNLSAVLVDANVTNEFGGTGKCADWQLAKEVANQYPTILAGGLNAENIGSAIARVQPYAVDICSGVENHFGHKSPEKMRHFFASVKR